MTTEHIERELRYLVTSDAWRSDVVGVRLITQGYIAASEVAHVRVRLTRLGYVEHTIDGPRPKLKPRVDADVVAKAGRGEERVETPKAVIAPERALDLLGDGLIGHIVAKLRWALRVRGHTWEVNEYRGRLAGLVLAEVELPPDAPRPEPPPWCGRDLTGVPGWSDLDLARYGRPGGAS